MKNIKVFVLDDNDDVQDELEYNLIKVIKEEDNITTMLVFDYDGDIAIVRAFKDYSVDPFRYIVKRKLMIPIWMSDEDEE